MRHRTRQFGQRRLYPNWEKCFRSTASTALAMRWGKRRFAPQIACFAFSAMLLVLTACGGEDDRQKAAPKPLHPDTPTNERAADTVTRVMRGDRDDYRNPFFNFKPAAQQAPRPTGPLPEDAGCITPECHANFAVATRVHAPVGEGSCEVCHAEDTGEHVYPIKREGNQTCYFCHTVTGTREWVHSPVYDPGCLSCHTPHAGNNKGLMKKTIMHQVCADCHDTKWKQYAHAPFASGDCMLCHEPHQSDSTEMLRTEEGREHCFECHEAKKQAVTEMPFVHMPAAAGCTNCHDPHSAEYPNQLSQPIREGCLVCHVDVSKQIDSAAFSHDAVFTDDSCTHCHDAHASEYANLTRGRIDRACLRCHDRDIVTNDGRTVADISAELARKYLHGPVRSGDCAACHNAHGSGYNDLLREGFTKAFYAGFDLRRYALCFQCHDPQLVVTEKTRTLTNFRNGDVNLHYVHVHRDEKGRTCRTCHAVHGSDNPRHIADAVPFDGSNFLMPIRFGLKGDGGSCAPECHEPMTYSRSAEPKAEPADRVEDDESRGVR